MPPPLGPQGLRPQTARAPSQSGTDPRAGTSPAPGPSTDPPPPRHAPEAGTGDGIDTDSEEHLNEVVRVMVGNPANELVLAEDHLALQFGELLYDQEVPNFDEVLAAVCVGRGGKGPWLIAVRHGSLRR